MCSLSICLHTCFVNGFLSCVVIVVVACGDIRAKGVLRHFLPSN